MPIRSNTARAFAEAFAQFGNNQDQEEQQEEEEEQQEEEEEKEQDEEQQPEAADPPPSPPPPPIDVEEEDEAEVGPPPPPIDVEEEDEAEVGENEDEDDARAEAIQIAAEEFDGWWALRVAEGADDDEAQVEVNNITLDTVRDGVVSKKTLDMYAHESLNFLSWCLTNRPNWVTAVATGRLQRLR